MSLQFYNKKKEQFFQDLYALYQRQGYAFINFLYFGSAMKYRVFEKPRNANEQAYHQALQNGDFLLPDGIALQIWEYLTKKSHTRLENLNGTDLNPALLSWFKKKGQVQLFIYSAYDPKIGKGPEWLDKGIQVCKERLNIENIYGYQSLYEQRGENFPWAEREALCKEPFEGVRVFLNCTGTPFQEVRTEQNRQWFEKHHMIVINAGGTIDFLSGFEQRAPQRVVRARVLETAWRITTNPKKNLKKFLAMFGVFRVIKYRCIHALKRILP